MKPQTPMSDVQQNPKPQRPKIWDFEHWDLIGIWSLVIGFLRKNGLSPKTYHLKPSGGYALMLSIVVSSIVLSIGLSLFNIVQKELILSATGRDSQFAFYSADGGVECAMYWDIKKLEFPESGVDWYLVSNPPRPGNDTVADCGLTNFGDDAQYSAVLEPNVTEYTCVTVVGPPLTTTCSGHEDDIVTINFQIKFQNASEDSPGSCALVAIEKKDNPNEVGYQIMTTIESKGYNADCAHVTSDNPTLVERAISVVY